MGWKDIFKSKSLRTKPDPRLRWFGKLPTYPDYYSSPADEEWAVEFNEWVMKGCEHYQNRLAKEDGAVHRMPISACVIRLPKSGMTVLSSILDFGGDMRGRKFPLCLYVAVPTIRWLGPTSDRFFGAVRVLDRLLRMRHEVARFLNNPGPLDAVLGNREIALEDFEEDRSDTSWTAGAETCSMGAWWDGVKDILKTENLPSFVAKAAEWGDLLTQHDAADFEPTLRFPLAMRVPFEAQLSGWLRWLEQRMDLEDRALSAIISGDLEFEHGYFTVIAREIVPDDFLLTTAQASALPYLDDLASMGSGQEGPEVGEPAASIDPRITVPERWLDFVQAPCRSA